MHFNSHALHLASAFLPGLSEIYLRLDDDFAVARPLPPDLFYARYEHEVASIVDWAKRRDLPQQSALLGRILPGHVHRWATHMPRC